VLSPGQEHFISNMIRQKLLTVIDSLPIPASGGRRWILFLPENEYHEFGLLYAQYIVRKSGDQVYYLGASVPLETLRSVSESVNPSSLLFFLVHRASPESIQLYLEHLNQHFPHTESYIGAAEAKEKGLKLHKGMKW